jgi:PAS domain S-box-containing protein
MNKHRRPKVPPHHDPRLRSAAEAQAPVSSGTPAELRECGEFTQRVIEGSKDSIKILDLEGRLLSMSKGALNLLEINDVAPYLNTSWVDFWKGQAREDALEAVAQAKKGVSGSCCGFYGTPKGGSKWCEAIVSPIEDAGGNIYRLLALSRDITERRQAEVALRTSSEQRQLALELAGLGAWEYRVDTGTVFWDERCRTQYGIAQGGPIDYTAVVAAIHPDDRAATEEAVRRALDGSDGGAYHREYRVVWPDGSVHWIDAHGQVLFDGEGERRHAVRIVGANLDITERKRLEEVQEFLLHWGYQGSSEDFFQALARCLAQSLGMDFVCIDRLESDGLVAQTVAIFYDGTFQDNVAYALKDTPCGEAVGKTICCFPKDVRQLFPKDEVLRKMRAECFVGATLWSIAGQPIGLIAVIGRKPLADSRLAESLLNQVAVRAAGELQRTQTEKALRRAHDELELRVLERTFELRMSNQQLRREIEVRRATEQELTEAQMSYRTVAEFTRDWEYWETPEYLLRYCSPSCERITGFSAQEFMADPRLLQQIVHPDDAGIWQKHRQESLAAPEPRVIQFRIRTKDRGVRWVEHAWQRVLGKDGVFLGIRACNRDITDRKEEELKNQQLQQELSHVTRVTIAGQLAASIAHELNQPLTAILTNAQTARMLLAANPPDLAEVDDALGDIEQDSSRAGEVIQRLRALFNKTGQQQTMLQIHEVIQETLDLLRSEFVLKGISTQVHLEPRLPKIPGNRIELQQVVLNLVINAMEAMNEGEPGQRQLQIATCLKGSDEILVSVRDSGLGIRVQPISRLFEPFFTTKAAGMGMGLAISQSIIEAHGGCLRAVNNPDRGATFELTLPIHHSNIA